MHFNLFLKQCVPLVTNLFFVFNVPINFPLNSMSVLTDLISVLPVILVMTLIYFLQLLNVPVYLPPLFTLIAFISLIFFCHFNNFYIFSNLITALFTSIVVATFDTAAATSAGINFLYWFLYCYPLSFCCHFCCFYFCCYFCCC